MGRASRLKRELRLAGMANQQGLPAASNSPQAQPLGQHKQPGMVLAQSVQYMGPTPPPAHVEAFERMLPGAAGRFLTLAEGEASHRRALEIEATKESQANGLTNRKLVSRGQFYAFVIAMSGIAAGFYLGIKGAQITGSIIGGGGLVTIILAFLRGGNTPPVEPQK